MKNSIAYIFGLLVLLSGCSFKTPTYVDYKGESMASVEFHYPEKSMEPNSGMYSAYIYKDGSDCKTPQRAGFSFAGKPIKATVEPDKPLSFQTGFFRTVSQGYSVKCDIVATMQPSPGALYIVKYNRVPNRCSVNVVQVKNGVEAKVDFRIRDSITPLTANHASCK